MDNFYQISLLAGLIAENITFQDDDQAYEKHQNCDSIDDVHRPDTFIPGPVRIFFPKEIASHFANLKKFFKPVSFLLHVKIFQLTQDQSNYRLLS